MTKDERAERLAAELRENLKRRKAQSRGQAPSGKQVSGEGGEAPGGGPGDSASDKARD
ncbi:hypothetical protein [Sphingomonas sp.]|uniref:hypothetical protein n=1 Tax=Sphingomonas sp. TaxID=28214 RepID=UPI0031D5F2C6